MNGIGVQFQKKALRRVLKAEAYGSLSNGIYRQFSKLTLLFMFGLIANNGFAATWYVNDGNTTGDIYTSAPGAATGQGLIATTSGSTSVTIQAGADLFIVGQPISSGAIFPAGTTIVSVAGGTAILSNPAGSTNASVVADITGGTGTAADPFGRLFEAVAAAVSGDIIYVDAGTYYAGKLGNPGAGGPWEANIAVDKALTIIGAGMGVTVYQNNNTNHVLMSINASNVTLRGVTIDGFDNESTNGLGVTPVGGQAVNIGNTTDNITNVLLEGVAVINSGNAVSSASQSALSIAEGAQVVIRNSAFSNNGNSLTNSAAGGAITIITGDAGGANPPRRMTDVFIENTVFNCNTRAFGTGGGGGAIHIMGGSTNDAGSIELRNCSFYGNRANASGGAICASAAVMCDLKVIGCTFEGNYTMATTDKKGGGAIAVMGGTNAYIYNSSFENNGTRDGSNLTVASNFQADGGAILVDNVTQASESVTIERCSFTDNYTGAGADPGLSTGHDIAASRGLVNIRNCFFNNTYTDGTATDDFVNIAFVSGSTNPPTVNVSSCGTLVTNGAGVPILKPEYTLTKTIFGVGADSAPAANLTQCAAISPMSRSTIGGLSSDGWTDANMQTRFVFNREAISFASAGGNTISPIYALPAWSTVSGATLAFNLGNYGTYNSGTATVQVFISTDGGATFPATPYATVSPSTASTSGVAYPTSVSISIGAPYLGQNVVFKLVAPNATGAGGPAMDNIRVQVCDTEDPTYPAAPIAIADPAASSCLPPSIAPPVADLQLVKTVSTARPTVGSTITYTITVTNIGPDDATGVSVEDILPSSGLSNIAAISNGGTLSGSLITWTGLSIANGVSMALTYTATVSQSGGTYTNIAEIIAADQSDPNSTPNNNVETGGNIGSADNDGTQDATDENDVDDAVINPCPQPTAIYVAPPSCYAPNTATQQNTAATADATGATPFATWKSAYDFAIAHPTVTSINFMPGTYMTSAPSTEWGDADGGYVLPAGLVVNGNGAVIDNTPLAGTSQLCFATLGNNTTVNGLSFIKFSGLPNGGALYVPATANNWTISNCNFESCNLGTDAVTVAVGAGMTGNITGCNFYLNSNPAATYSSSLGNATSSALFITGSNAGDLNITNTSFSCNFSNDGGGAVDITNAHVDFTGCSFTKNEANASVGGAVDISGTAVVSFTNTDFTGNFTSGGTTYDGGAVSIISNATVSFTGCNFSDNGHVGATWNSAADTQYGGAIYVANSPNAATTGNAVTISNCQFYNNTARRGGGVYGDISTNISVSNSYFTNNYAGDTNSTFNGGGGGLFIRRDAASCQVQNLLSITGSSFVGNKNARNSNTSGAGVKIYGSCPITATIDNTLIDNNRYNAANSGAAGTLEANYDAPTALGITLTNNEITATSSVTQTNASAGYTGTVEGANTIPNTCPATIAPATACLTACGITIAGNLYQDSDALTDGTVDGTLIGAASGTQLYANLVQGGVVVQSVAIPTSGVGLGTFTFTDVPAGSYTVVIAQNATATTPSLPSGWTNVGEAFGTNNGAGTGNEGGTPNGSIAVTAATTNITAVNFGINAPTSDLQLVKTVSPAVAAPGDVVTFTITVTNNGTDAATGISVEDIVPNGYSNIAAISNSGTNASGTITWTGLSLANGVSVALTFTATVVAPAAGISYVNIAEVTASSNPDPDSTPDNNTATSGNIGSVEADGTQNTTTPTIPASEDDVDDAIVAVPLIGLVKGSSLSLGADNMATAGDIITYTYVVTNTGNVTLTSVAITEQAASFTGTGTLPTPVYVAGSSSLGSIEGTLLVGESATYIATYAITAADILATFVDNQAQAAGTPPVGSPVTDLSDSSNPADVNETGTPGDLNGDDPTNTPISSCIAAATAPTGTNQTLCAAGGALSAGPATDAGQAGYTVVYLLANASNVIVANASTITGLTAPAHSNAAGTTCPAGSNEVYTLYTLEYETAQGLTAIVNNTTTLTTIADAAGDVIQASPSTIACMDLSAAGITVAVQPPIIVTYANKQCNVANTSYSVDVTICGGSGTYNLSNENLQGGTSPTFIDGLTAGTYTISGITPGQAISFDIENAAAPLCPKTGNTTAAINCTPTSPNITIVKSNSPTGTVQVGNTITYTITVTNSGTAPATTLVISDAVPANTTYVAGSATNGATFAAGTLTLNVASLSHLSGSNTSSFSYQVTVNAGTAAGTIIPNTAQVQFTENDANGDGVQDTPINSNQVTNTVVAPAISIVKSNSPTGTVQVGNTITYTITVTNSGTAPATTLVISDAVPANTTYVAGSATNGATFAAGTLTLNVASLSHLSGSNTSSFSYQVTVNAGTAAGTVIPNTAQVQFTENDANGDGIQDTPINSNQVSNTVVAPAISIVKSNSPTGTVQVGNTITYTITVTNSGTAPATTLVISDAVPANTTYVAGSATNGATFAAGTLTLNVASLSHLSGSNTSSFSYQVTVNAGTAAGTIIPNTAQVQFTENDANGDGVQDTPINSNQVTNTVVAPVLTATKASTFIDANGNGQLNPGETVQYTVILNNIGGGAAYNVVFNDTPDANTTLIVGTTGTSPQGTVTLGNSAGDTNVGVNVGTVNPGSTVVIVFSVTVDNPFPVITPSQILNQGVFTSSNHADVPTDDPDTPLTPGDPTIDPVGAAPILSVSKSNNPTGTVQVGNTITYTITVTNTGNIAANNVVVSDAIPANTTYVTGSATNGATFAAGTLTLNVANLAATSGSNTASFSYQVTVNAGTAAGTVIPNTAQATSDEVTTPVLSNTVTNTVGAPAVTIVKSNSPTGTVQVGNTITYTITVTNSGTAPATTLVISDAVPANTTYVTGSATNGATFAAGTLTLNMASLSHLSGSNTSTFSYQVTVNVGTAAGTVIPNTAQVQFTENDANGDGVQDTPINSNQVTNTVVAPVLTAVKTSTFVDANGDGQLNPGEQINYVLTVTNSVLAGGTAFSVTLNDPLSSDINYVAGTAAAVSTGTGPASAAYNAGTTTVTASLGNLAPGQSATVVFSATVDNPYAGDGTIENQGIFSASNHADVPTDNPNTPIILGDPTVNPVASPILTAVKTSTFTDANGDTKLNPGETINYVLIVTNSASASGTAVNVTLNDPMPSDINYVGGTVFAITTGTGPANAAYNGTAIVASLGNLAPGQSATISFSATVDNPYSGDGIIENQGIFSAINHPDVPTDNPTTPIIGDPTTDPVFQPIMTATKTSTLTGDTNGNGVLNPGETLHYTIVLTNSGSGDALSVVFNDTPDANTNLVVGTVTTSQGTVTLGNSAGNTSVGVSVGTVPANGGTVTVQFDVTLDNPLASGITQILNQGVFTSSNYPDVPTDDPDTPTTPDPTIDPVNASPDVYVTKTDNGVGVGAGDILLYTINYGNLGNQTATGVVLTETVPANTNFNAGASSSGWTAAGGGVYTYNVGSLATGATGSVVYAVTVNNPLASTVTTLLNTVLISNTNGDSNPANNTDTEDTPVCGANAGNLTFPTGVTALTICQGQDLGAFGTNVVSNANYEYTYVLTGNTSPYTILATSAGGDFNLSGLNAGSYAVWGLAYSTANTPSSVATYLAGETSVTGILADISNGLCADITNRAINNSQVVITILSPIQAGISTPPACVGSAGAFTYNATIFVNGGGGIYTVTASSTAALVTNNGNGTYTISNIPNGQNITLTVTDNSSCPDPAAIALVAPNCACTLASITYEPNQGYQGGISPYAYTTAVVTITGGVLPYTFNWNNNGYVRYDIVYTNGGATITIIYADDAVWAVTATDQVGCQTIENNDPSPGTDGNPGGFLDIVNYTIAPHSTLIPNGSITLTVEGGTPLAGGQYQFQWSGPANWGGNYAATAAGVNYTLTGLPYGWYSLTVTDAVGGTTEGWYWVPRARRGRTKTDNLDSGLTAMTVYPNPFSQTATLEFVAATSTQTTVKLTATDGKEVAVLFDGTVESGKSYTLAIDATHLPAGVYVASMVTNDGKVVYEKVVITK